MRLTRTNGNSELFVFVLLGLLAIGLLMVGLSAYLPKQFTTCSPIGGSSEQFCVLHVINNEGYMCTMIVSPSQSEGLCRNTSFWELTQFWVFDLGIVGVILVFASASILVIHLRKKESTVESSPKPISGEFS